MSLYDRGGYWHYEFVVAGQRHRGSTRIRVTNKGPQPPTAALKKLAEARSRVGVGGAVERVWTLGDVSARWFNSRIKGAKSETTTLKRMKLAVALVGATLPIEDIDTPTIEDAIRRRREMPTRNTRSRKPEEQRFPTNSTVNRDMIDTTLRPIFSYAEEILELPRLKRIRWNQLRREEPAERVRSFTDEELQRWKSALPAWHWPISEFMSRYGLRLKEAFFPPSAFDGSRITIPGRSRKNKKPIVIPIVAEDIPAITERVKAAREAGFDTIWIKDVTITRKNGESRRVHEPIHWRAYQSASALAIKRAGITDARPAHDFRHHAATSLLRKTGNIRVVGKLLGHSNLATTERYAHVYDADVLAALSPQNPPHKGKKSKKA